MPFVFFIHIMTAPAVLSGAEARANGKPAFKTEEAARDLGIVWGMAFLNEREILLTERSGKFKKLNLKTKQAREIPGAPKVFAKGQGGLLDVTLHPNFSKNKKVYFCYSKSKGRKRTTVLAEGILKGDRMLEVRDLFSAKPAVSTAHHFGCRLVFDGKGFLFMTVGDRGKRHSAQSLKSHLGKILRLTDEGAPAKGNPFTGRTDALAEIWSFGHRNPQGLFIHPETGALWGQEHGPRGGDEINLIQKGKNYGWPVITFGREYWGPPIGEGAAKKGMEQPVKHWTPSIAPSGLLIYSGKRFKNWKGDFFSGALALTHLNRLKIRNGKVKEEERLLSRRGFRVRNVVEGPDGLIYVSIDRGRILRLVPRTE